MKYFAYGSNMVPERLRARAPSAKVLDGIYLLKGYKLKFHKIGKDGSAKCNAYYTGSDIDIVEGVVFEIDHSEVVKLDRIEGVGKGYEKKNVKISNNQGYTVEAFAYFATRIDESLLPFTWYKVHVLNGAKKAGLSAEYISMINKMKAQEDPDIIRKGRELKIYE